MNSPPEHHRCRPNLHPLPLPPPPSTTISNTVTLSNLHRPASRIYALKVIYLNHVNHNDNLRRQLFREFHLLRNVDNPYVVKCFNMFDYNGEIQMLLEYMDRGSLQGKHITDEAQLAHLSKQVLSGLLYLHRNKIVHGDIKPSNLLINSNNQVKIARFGVSRVVAHISNVGTVAYMSPERIDTYDGYAGDIWSFGVSVLEFYLGRFPFNNGRQGDWASLMCAICMNAPPEAPPEASIEFRNFIQCCLQREPRKRWGAAMLLNHPFIVNNTRSGGGAAAGDSCFCELQTLPLHKCEVLDYS